MYINNFNFLEIEAEKYWSCPKNEDLKELTKNLVFSGDYLGARKIDGFWEMIIKDDQGNIFMRGRNRTVKGDFTNKIDWVPHIKEEVEKLPNGTVLIGELYFPDNEGSKNVSTILGCLKPKALARQSSNKLHFYAFDLLAIDGANYTSVPFCKRIEAMYRLKPLIDTTYFHFAHYYKEHKLWEYIGWAFARGYEGVVIQHKNGTYDFGKRTARKSLKIKKEINSNIDAFLSGKIKMGAREYVGKEPEKWEYWMDVRTNELKFGVENYDVYFETGCMIPVTKDFYYGVPASIEFVVLDDKGNDVHLCWISNLTDEIKNEVANDPNHCRGKVALISAMEIDSKTNKLRHSKIVQWRDDIPYTDCTLDKLHL